MGAMVRGVRKLWLLLGRGRFRSELDEEMAFHRAQAEKDFVGDGMKPEDARYAAMRQLGNATRLREQSEEVVGFRVETVWQDVRFAARQLRKSPGFGVTAVLILALGMGVSVAIFGFVDAALLQPLPYVSPDRLMDVAERGSMFPRSNLSRADYEDWKQLNRSFTSLEAYTGTGYLLAKPDGAIPVPGARVSDGFFRALGVKPMLGRDFLSGEDKPGGAKTVMLTYGAWLKRFAGNQNVVGQSVTLSGDAYTIVGVLPREFVFAPRGNAEFYVPLLDKRSGCEERRSCHNLFAVGRLRDGVTMQAALEDLKGIAAQLEKQYPGSNQGQGAFVAPLSELIVGQVRPVLLTLLGGAGLLLLIASVNVASLVLVRSESRRREIAVRGALGATRVRLMRQFVTEGLLLGGVGCLGGVVIGAWIMTLMKRLVPQSVASGIPFLDGVGVNAHTALFAVGIAVGAALLLALTPVLRLSFQDIRSGLGEGGRAAAGRLWQRLGANLVVVELAVAVVLLVGAALLGQSFYRLLHVENGFDTTHLGTVQVMAPDSKYGKPEQAVALNREVIRRMLALPGVTAVGLTTDLPVQCNCNTDWIRVVGKPYHGEHNDVNEREVTPGYFDTLKAKLVRGRVFTDGDSAGKPQAIVINEALARKYFPGEDPVGQKVANGALDPKSMREIVGVIADVREGGLDGEIWPAEYEAMYQNADNGFSVAVRTAGDEKALLPEMVKALHAIDRDMGVYGETTMTDQISSTQEALLHRFATWLVAGFAVMALVLGVVGLYGVVAYSVSQRTREIGVRMALGAQRGTVYGMVMRQASWLTGVGVGAGLVCSVVASLAMKGLLFGVKAWDVPTLAVVAVVLGGASLLASFLPARRAASVNPMEALRAE